MQPGIIIINGTSSTGKTTTARLLQKIFSGPLFYLGLDLWIRETLSERFWEPALRLEDINQSKETCLGTHILLPHTDENPTNWPSVGSGPISDIALFTMHQTARDFYQRGHWVVIDHVLLTHAWYLNLLETTQGCRRFFIKLTCDMAILELREQQRGNRIANIFKGLAETIHQGVDYDLVLDSSHTTPQVIAESILHFPAIQQLLYTA